MKKWLGLLLTVCAIGTVTGGDLAAALRRMPAAHPRLLTGNGGETRWQTALKSADGQAFAARILHDADVLSGQPPVPRKLTGRRLLMNCRRVLYRINTLTVAYRISGEKRYAAQAIKEMESAVGFSDWNPSHFLDVAEMTLALAIGYDGLYAEMPPEQQRTIRTAIIEKGLKPSLAGKQWWIDAGTNWTPVCHAGMVAGALAIYEDEPALTEQIVARALKSMPGYLRKSYSAQGAYPEGPMYWVYGTEFTALLFALLDSTLGGDFVPDAHPGFAGTVAYINAMTAPSGYSFNYADAAPSRIAYGFAQGFLIARYRRTDCFSAPLREAFDRQTADRTQTIFRNDDRLLPLVLFFIAGTPAKGAADLPRDYFSGADAPVPVSMHRSGSDGAAVYLGLKAGSPMGPHGHMDSGSFMIEADGVRWAADLGMEDYTRLEKSPLKLWNTKPGSDRWEKIFRLGYRSHNIPLIDGQSPRAQGKATITGFSAIPARQRTVIDLTPLYAGQADSAVRTAELLPDRRIVITDRFTGVKPGAHIRFQLCTRAAADGADTDRLMLMQAGRTMALQGEAPAPVRWRVTPEAELRQAFDSPNPGFSMVWFEVPAAADGKCEIKVVFTPGSTREKGALPHAD